MRLIPPAIAAPKATAKAAKKSASAKRASEAKTKANLAQLQASAAVVSSQMLQTDRTLHTHLSQAYMWWRDARLISGYLDAEYKANGDGRKPRAVSYGTNFGPMFRLIWGSDSGLTYAKSDRWSRVLNKLHDQYETQKQYHTDSVAKLQNYISTNGGVDGLSGYGKSLATEDADVASDDEVDALPVPDTPRLSTDEMVAELFGSARDFYCAVSAPTTVEINATIPLTADGLGLVLVRKVGNKFQLIGASSDDTMVQPVAVQTYLHDYTALPQALRVVTETLCTQCLPLALQKFYNSLVDDVAKGASIGKAKSVRRLLYMHASEEILLSPMHAESGVVTIAKPKQQVFANVRGDVFLATRSRRAAERRLIAGSDFNFYQTAIVGAIPEYTTPNLASHIASLHHRFAPNDNVYMTFWPFYVDAPDWHDPLSEDVAEQPTQLPGDVANRQTQLTVNALTPSFGTWRGTLSLAWFRKFAIEFTTPWLQGQGTNITRAKHKVFLLAIGMKDLTVHYVCCGGLFENEITVDFDGALTAGEVMTVCVLSKDFAVAMQAIADLGVVSAVQVEIDSDVLAIRFSTTAADYRLYIPTCTIEGVRSGKHFKHHLPATTVLSTDTFESYYDPADVDGSNP